MIWATTKMLSDYFAPGSIAIAKVRDFSEAIAESGKLLQASGRVAPEYVEQMLAAVADYGPYIVIAPGVAIAHSRPSEAVLETGLSLFKPMKPIVSGHSSNDPVSLVFGLAAYDHASHIDLMKDLAAVLGNQQIMKSLLNSSSIGEIRTLIASVL